MSDPLVTELRDASCHANTTLLNGCELLKRAADALDAAAVREQRLRAALEEALDEWERAAQYKAYLTHKAAKRIAELRALAHAE